MRGRTLRRGGGCGKLRNKLPQVSLQQKVRLRRRLVRKLEGEVALLPWVAVSGGDQADGDGHGHGRLVIQVGFSSRSPESSPGNMLGSSHVTTIEAHESFL